MKPADKLCSKCNTTAPCKEWDGREQYEPDTPQAVFGCYALQHFHPEVFVNAIFECPIHGEFAILDSGEFYFDVPDVWVRGLNGKRLFRT